MAAVNGTILRESLNIRLHGVGLGDGCFQFQRELD